MKSSKEEYITTRAILLQTDQVNRKGEIYPADTLRDFEGSNIIVSFDGEVLGSVQSISIDARREDPADYEFGALREGLEASITFENATVNQQLLQELLNTNVYASQEVTTLSSPNRTERRKTSKQKMAKANENRFKKGVRQMLGGKGNWN